MTQFDIHPEHLIDRVLRGTASAAERGELSAHMRVCSVCGVERELAQALREPLSAELDSTSGAVDAALAVLVGTGRLAPGTPSHANPGRSASEKARAWLPWAAAACLFFTGSAAAATLIMAVRGSAPSADASASPSAAASPHERARVKRAAPSVVAAQPDSAQPPEPTTASAMTASTPQPAPQARARRAPVALPPQATAPDAAELFAKARAAAIDDRFAEAAALYATLQKRFASSPQAHVSRVVLGRLYLEHLADPRAALVQFDAYLQQGGPNRPEALLGRAHALRALGRVQAEVETLRTLVDAYPESLYVAPAEERLRAVE